MGKSRKRWEKRFYPESIYPEVRINRLIIESFEIDSSPNINKLNDSANEVLSKMFTLLQSVEIDVKVEYEPGRKGIKLSSGFKNVYHIQFLATVVADTFISGSPLYSRSTITSNIGFFINATLLLTINLAEEIIKRNRIMLSATYSLQSKLTPTYQLVWRFVVNGVFDYFKNQIYDVLLIVLNSFKKYDADNLNDFRDDYLKPLVRAYLENPQNSFRWSELTQNILYLLR